MRFFLLALQESANDAIEAIDKLTALHEKYKLRIAEIGRSAKTVSKVFAYIEKNPIIEIKKTALALGMSFNTIASAVTRMQEMGILVQTENVRRNRTFSYEAYLEILRSGT